MLRKPKGASFGTLHWGPFRQRYMRLRRARRAGLSSSGAIGGTVTDGVLRFSWRQADGQTGAGMFSLSNDGQRLEGTVSLSGDPNQADGLWTGFRR